jgi:hypothetical protein
MEDGEGGNRMVWMDGQLDRSVSSIVQRQGGGGGSGDDEGQRGIYPVSYRREVHLCQNAETEGGYRDKLGYGVR